MLLDQTLWHEALWRHPRHWLTWFGFLSQRLTLLRPAASATASAFATAASSAAAAANSATNGSFIQSTNASRTGACSSGAVGAVGESDVSGESGAGVSSEALLRPYLVLLLCALAHNNRRLSSIRCARSFAIGSVGVGSGSGFRGRAQVGRLEVGISWGVFDIEVYHSASLIVICCCVCGVVGVVYVSPVCLPL